MSLESEQAKLAKQLKEANDKRGTPLQVDALKYIADSMYDVYKSYVAAGFTEQQALYLITYKS